MTAGDLVEIRIPDGRPGFPARRTVLGRIVAVKPERDGIPAHAMVKVGSLPPFARWSFEMAPPQEEDDNA